VADRVNPHVAYREIVCNQSSRAGARPSLIVVHATQSSNRAGLGDLAAIGSWFDNPAAQCSSHVCTDAEGNSARYVTDRMKAWHCANYNRVSLGIEQIGFAESAAWTEAEMRETARWIARWSVAWGIPIQKGVVHKTGTVAVVRAGVVRHSDLGALGGGHSDPGRHYDLHEVLEMARSYRRRLVK
jgi:N-acetyl-anhydromuramyl-L-alanine amidase AmpD